MYTIKIQGWENDYPIEGENGQIPAKCFTIFEGQNIFRRSFEMHSLTEYEEWCKKYFRMAQGTGNWLHVIGEDPSVIFKERKDGLVDIPLSFDFISWEDKNHSYHRAIMTSSNCYIMNEQGQNVDQF